MSDYTSQIKQLLPWQRTAFITALTERMYPNYLLFTELAQWGDAAPLRKVLDKSWAYVKQGTREFSGWESWHTKIEEQVPHQQDFDMFGVFAAIDTMVCASLLLDSYKDEHANFAVSASELSTDLVQFYIDATTQENMTDDEFEVYVNKHDLMLQEQDFQAQLLELLAATEHANQLDWPAFIAFAENEHVSNIGIAIEPALEE